MFFNLNRTTLLSTNIFTSAFFSLLLCSGPMSLIDAARGGDIDKVKQLIAQGDEVNQVDANGCTPIYHAAINVSRLTHNTEYFIIIVSQFRITLISCLLKNVSTKLRKLLK